MSEAPTTVIENAPTAQPSVSPAPAANTPEARTPEGQLKAVTEPLMTPPTTPQTPTATTAGEVKEPPKEGEKSLLNESEAMNGAPDKYEAFKAPEGYETNPERMAKAQSIFKELNLSQAGGQKLVDFFMDEIKSTMEAPQKEWEELRTKWIAEVKSDPEIGGKLDQVKVTVSRMIDNLGAKLASDFRREMDATGMGNNPTFIRVLHKVAEKLTEGTPVSGGYPSKLTEVKAPGAPLPSAAHALYPNLK